MYVHIKVRRTSMVGPAERTGGLPHGQSRGMVHLTRPRCASATYGVCGLCCSLDVWWAGSIALWLNFAQPVLNQTAHGVVHWK